MNYTRKPRKLLSLASTTASPSSANSKRKDTPSVGSSGKHPVSIEAWRTTSLVSTSMKRGAHDKHAYLRFSKIGWVKIQYSRPIPDHATIKEVTFKKETTGEWFVSFGLEADDEHTPEKPDVDELDASNSVGIDLGILNYIHTSDGKTVDWLNREDDYECLRRE